MQSYTTHIEALIRFISCCKVRSHCCHYLGFRNSWNHDYLSYSWLLLSLYFRWYLILFFDSLYSSKSLICVSWDKFYSKWLSYLYLFQLYLRPCEKLMSLILSLNVPLQFIEEIWLSLDLAPKSFTIYLFQILLTEFIGIVGTEHIEWLVDILFL